jgi:ABC-type uncharacterized transport system permease subunit
MSTIAAPRLRLRRPDEAAVRLVGLTVLSIGIALLLAFLLVSFSGGSPTEVLDALVTGSVADSAGWSQTLVNATPLLLVALGACISNRAGVFNIGQEGQLMIGAMVTCWVALHMGGPGWLVLTVSLATGAIAGGAWAGASAVMYYRRGVNIVVSTLLLSLTGVLVVQYAVNQPWLLQQQRRGTGQVPPQSDQLPEYLRLPTLGEYPGLVIGVGLVVALALAALLSVLLARSRWGFRLRMLGLNPLVARHAGIRAPRLGGMALALSGAFAGLAGGIILAGVVFRLQPALSNNFGWDGLLVALVARSRPLLAVPVAVLFGGLRAGASFLATTGVPNYLVDVVQALLVLAFVIPPVLNAIITRYLAQRRRAGAEAAATSATASTETAAPAPFEEVSK